MDKRVLSTMGSRIGTEDVEILRIRWRTDGLTSEDVLPEDISFRNQGLYEFIWGNVFVSFLAGPSKSQPFPAPPKPA